jgi:hypothetical protein
LVAVLGAGTGLGAVLAVVTAPGISPAQWVANLLATTAHAGSARFTYSRISTSPNTYLAGRSQGTGQINFGSGDVRTTDVEHDIQFSGEGPGSSTHPTPTTNRTETIGVGKVSYLDFGIGGDPGRPQWIKTGLRRDPHATVAETLADNVGISLGAGAGLGAERVVAVRDVGSTMVEGAPTTSYLVTTAPVCTAPNSAKNKIDGLQTRSTTLWVDAKGRLVQARSSERINDDPPKSFFSQDPGLASRLRGRVTSTSTFDFSAFGQPVHISAPAVGDARSAISSSFGTIKIVCNSKNGSSKR